MKEEDYIDVYPAKLKLWAEGSDLIYVFEVEGLPKHFERPLRRLNAFVKLAIYSKGGRNGEE